MDENGKVLYGTRAFVGGTKVYIDDKTWGLNEGYVSVIGLNRFKRYAVESIPVDSIVNVRLQRIYKPTVIEIMNYLEISDGWVWRGRTVADRKEISDFVRMWNNL